MIPAGNAQFWMENCPDCNYQLRLREPTNGKCTECGWAFDAQTRVFSLNRRLIRLNSLLFCAISASAFLFASWVFQKQRQYVPAAIFLVGSIVWVYGIILAIQLFISGGILIAFCREAILMRPLKRDRIDIDWCNEQQVLKVKQQLEQQLHWVGFNDRTAILHHFEEISASRRLQGNTVNQ